ncbi:MAG: hypothetical protein PHU23_11630 [Dehalococcoidales bacterium]|nr:hypothetical protein [Dehalococcoidales bacterium]
MSRDSDSSLLTWTKGRGDPTYLLFDESLQSGRHWKAEPERRTEIVRTTARWRKDSFIVTKICNVIPRSEVYNPLYFDRSRNHAIADNHLWGWLR